MALTPMLALGVLFILWAGRSARAELVTSLAAQEAAVAAALCCNDAPSEHLAVRPDLDESTAVEPRRELMAEAALDAKPGLDYLCLSGLTPARGRPGFVSETTADLTEGTPEDGLAHRVLVVTTQVTCQTDGAIAPIRGLFGTRTVHGHGAHVVVLTRAAEANRKTPEEEHEETPGEPRRDDGGPS